MNGNYRTLFSELLGFGKNSLSNYIDDSKPAYNFKPVVFPNEWQKSKRRSNPNQTSEKMEAYRSYFQKLLDDLRDKHKFTNAKKGQPQSWYTFSSGFPGIYYGASFALGNRVRVEIYIDQGDVEKNKSLFDALFEDRSTIENDYGSDLDWERLDEKRSCRIAIYKTGSIESSDEELLNIREWTVDNLLKFKNVFNSRFRKLVKK